MKYSRIKLDKILINLGIDLPHDYLDFIVKHDGEYLNELNSIDFWPLDKLAQYNEQCESSIYLPNFIIIGTNGGGAGLAIKLTTGEIYSLQMVSMDEEDVIKIANNFTQFMELFNTTDLIYI